MVYRLDGNPHEVTIKDTKYFVKELYACEKHKGQIVTVRKRFNESYKFLVLGPVRWGED